MNNKWLEHVKQYQQNHNVSYKEAMTHAKHTYSGGSIKSDLVRRMYYSKNFNPKRVSNPSKNIKMAVKKHNKKEYEKLEKEFEIIINKK